jgi:alpha-mannosidase
VIAVDHPGVLVSAVKRADDGSGDLVVRLHEALGDRARVRVRAAERVVGAARCNLMEEPVSAEPVVDGTVDLALRPFELVTLRLGAPEGSAARAAGMPSS